MTTTRRAFVAGSVALLAAPRAAESEQARPPWRIGYLSLGKPDAYSAAFLSGLRDLGWTDGRDFIVDWRWAGGTSEPLTGLARELVAVRPDALVAVTTPAARAALTATATIPTVFTMVADPVGSGFVVSFARPGRNATGLSFVPELEFFSKQLELLRELVPGLARVAIVWAPTNPIHAGIADVTQSAAGKLGLEVLSRPVHTFDAIDQVFAELRKARPSAILVIADNGLAAYQ